MEEIIFGAISPLILIAIGIVLIALEILTFTFILLWFGIAFVIVGLLSYLIPFSDGIYQVGMLSIISILLLFTLRTKSLEIFMKAKNKDHNDDFLNQSGIGIIRDGKVYFKATYWNIVSNDKFEENENVTVISTEGSNANIKKLI